MDLGWLYDLWQIPSIKAAVVTITLGAILDVVRRLIVPRGRVAWGISHNEHFIYRHKHSNRLPSNLNSQHFRYRYPLLNSMSLFDKYSFRMLDAP